MLDLTNPAPRGGHHKSVYEAWPHTRSALDSLRALAITPALRVQVEKADRAFAAEDLEHFGSQQLVHSASSLFSRPPIAREVGR